MNFSSRKLQMLFLVFRREKRLTARSFNCMLHGSTFISCRFNKHLANASILCEYWPLNCGRITAFCHVRASIKIKLNADKQQWQWQCSENYTITCSHICVQRVMSFHRRWLLFNRCTEAHQHSTRENCYTFRVLNGHEWEKFHCFRTQKNFERMKIALTCLHVSHTQLADMNEQLNDGRGHVKNIWMFMASGLFGTFWNVQWAFSPPANNKNFASCFYVCFHFIRPNTETGSSKKAPIDAKKSQ